MQADGRLVAKGGVARYTGVFDAFGKIFRSVGHIARVISDETQAADLSGNVDYCHRRVPVACGGAGALTCSVPHWSI